VSSTLEGKNVVITGGGGGIGRALALSLAGWGANIVVSDYGVSMDGSDPTSEIADSVVSEITAAGGNAIAVADDISTMAAGERVVNAAVENWGSIDGVVCVAGILRERMLFNMTEDEWDSVIRVHLKGHFTVYRAASAIMRKQETGGSLVGFTSGAFTGSTAQANYSAAKAGIVALTRSAALALRRYNINANCVAPTARTRMSENVPFEIETGDPDDISPVVAHLLSDAGRDITGQIYTSVGPRVAVWNQAQEVRSATAPDGVRFTPEQVGEALHGEVGQEEHPFMAAIDDRIRQMNEKKAAEAAEG
jgi:NAD(P)-dependent dehydrogenase (short-subunit alcohol dehydrogenase family)